MRRHHASSDFSTPDRQDWKSDETTVNIKRKKASVWLADGLSECLTHHIIGSSPLPSQLSGEPARPTSWHDARTNESLATKIFWAALLACLLKQDRHQLRICAVRPEKTTRMTFELEGLQALHQPV